MLPMPLAPAIIERVVGVDESAPPGSPAGLSTMLVSSVPELVIELFDEDEPESSTPSVGGSSATSVILTTPAASATLDILGPFAPCAAGSPDMSRDEEITRKLFVELNHEAIGILGDGGLVILSSDSEEEVTEEEEADEEEDEPTGSGSSSKS
ncbi:unnamed protein product [Miscanthus lutarioriparius]|uniref:Uncharacterized protein n=1 Tax=Miscanthus lutarioriparius TaxID=422564 RepID=A0A811S3A4_9POAL|nr:unnamed protein product [Miscanthus lutarioriparius]